MAKRVPTRVACGIGLGAGLIAALVFYFNFHTVIVQGMSMEPTFHTGQKVLVSKAYWLIGPIRDNDIVVAKDTVPGQYIIKRVYKMGGERVDYTYAPKSWSLALGDYTVPAGTLYLLGDNLEVSEDSRSFGPVDVSKVLGKVVILK